MKVILDLHRIEQNIDFTGNTPTPISAFAVLRGLDGTEVRLPVPDGFVEALVQLHVQGEHILDLSSPGRGSSPLRRPAQQVRDALTALEDPGETEFQAGAEPAAEPDEDEGGFSLGSLQGGDDAPVMTDPALDTEAENRLEALRARAREPAIRPVIDSDATPQAPRRGTTLPAPAPLQPLPETTEDNDDDLFAQG